MTGDVEAALDDDERPLENPRLREVRLIARRASIEVWLTA